MSSHPSASSEPSELEPSTFEPSHEIERRAARGGVVVAVGQGVKTGLEGLGLLVLSRSVLPEEFGLVDMIVAVTGLIDQLKDFGLGTALIQKDRISHQQINALFWVSLAVGAGLSLLIAALAPLIALGYGQPELRSLALALSCSTVLGAVCLQQQALLKRALRFKALAGIEVVSTFAGVSLAVWAALSGWGAWALVVRQLVLLSSQALLCWIASGWRPTKPERHVDVADLLRFGGHLSGYQVLNYLERNFDNVLIGRFAGARALGLYAKAYEIMRLPLTVVNAPLATVAVPALSRLAKVPDRYRNAYRSVTRLLLLLTVPLCPLMIFAADPLIPWILGDNWAPAVPIFRVLTLALVIKPLLFTTSWLFISQGRGRDVWTWGVTGTSIALVSFLVGLPWGALGVAISYTGFDLVLRAPLLVWWTGRRGPVCVRDLIGCLWPAWTGASVVAVVLLVSHRWLPVEPSWLRDLVGAALAVAFGALSVWVSPWGKSALRDGMRMLATLRVERASGAQT